MVPCTPGEVLTMIHETADVSKSATIGNDVKIWHHAHVREDVVIGDNCILAEKVYVDKGVVIGNNCKIQNRSSLYHGSVLGNGVFIGPHCVLTNDRYPRAINNDGSVKSDSDWEEGKIMIREGASLGAGVIVLPGVTIGKYALIGAGTVVVRDVPDYGLVYGNRGELRGYVCKCGRKLSVGKLGGENCEECLL